MAEQRQETVRDWLDRLNSHRTRHAARLKLEACGPSAAADAVLAFAQGTQVSENARWAAIQLLAAWKWQPAAPYLFSVLKGENTLRFEALRALQAVTRMAIEDDVPAWEKALGLAAAAAPAAEPAPAESAAVTDGPELALLRRAVGDVAIQLEWDAGGYAYLCYPLAEGRSQQLLVTFTPAKAGEGETLGLYTECGAMNAAAPDMMTRRNVTVRFGKFVPGKNAEGADTMTLRYTLPRAKATPALLRGIIAAMAEDADSFEEELTHADAV